VIVVQIVVTQRQRRARAQQIFCVLLRELRKRGVRRGRWMIVQRSCQ